ncbi:IS110 family transposase [Streptomyces sp. NBC_01635]|uniref:IS110 family transposase n=1 Tax=Streptomyces sp. NBC_01635 TaxID=2975904 RepID=UPI0038693639|nr:IS110 family transposase [Streptomyces sp. NBC_01635]
MDESEAVDQTAELVERVAAIDVAKASGMLCLRLPHERIEGRRTQRVWNVGATTNAILELGDHLLCQGVTRVVMEATGSYWKPWFYLLEARGLECWLVNARDVKNVPGRPKTDKLDAVWLCKLAERGMLRPSFVPPKPIRELRDLTRLRSVFIGERSRNRQRIEKVLEDAQIKLSSVATNLFDVSGRAMLEALIGGERSPQALAGLARGRLVSKRDALVEALTVQVDELSQRITAQLAGIRLPEAEGDTGRPRGAPGGTGEAGLLSLVERLDEIPGIGRTAAEVIVAELGPDMRVFPTSGHLVSWARLAPRTIQSGGKNTSGPTGHGNPWLKGMIGEAAMAAARTETFLGARYRRLVKHRGRKKALVAVARSMLVIVWHIINDPAARFEDLGPDHHQRLVNPVRKPQALVRQLQALGHQVTLTPVETAV